jgi:hypothetical protein
MIEPRRFDADKETRMPRRFSYLLPTLVLLAVCAGTARAENFALAGRFGTPGFGGEAAVALVRGLNVRVGANFGGLTKSAGINLSSNDMGADIDFTGKLRLRSLTALLDWHPGNGGLRLSAGIVRNSNRLTLDAIVTANVTINDHTYTANDVTRLFAEGELGRRWVPYAGLGFGNAVDGKQRVTLLFDMGVFFQGRPTVTLSAEGVATGLPSLQDDLDTEAAKLNNDDLNKSYFKFYPVISVGVAVKLF